MKFVSAFVGDLSGSVGGVVASRARGGVDYFRFRATPVNPNTSRQQGVRNALAALSQKWKFTLTAGDRDSWSNQVIGTVKSGINAFVDINTTRRQCGLDDVDEYTGALAPDASTVAIASYSAGALTITFDDADTWANTDGAALALYMKRPIPPSRTFENRERFVGSIDGDSVTPPGSPAAFASPWGNSAVAGDIVEMRGRLTMPDGTVQTVNIAPFTAT